MEEKAASGQTVQSRSNLFVVERLFRFAIVCPPVTGELHFAPAS